MGMRRPDFRAIADEGVAIVFGRHGQLGQVGPGMRLGIALAPEVLARQDAGQVIVLLFRRAVADQRRAAHADAHGAERRSACPRHLDIEDVVLGDRPVAAAILDRP